MASTLHALESPSQNPDDMQIALEQLKQFRQQLYSSLAYRGDTIMDLLDALSSNTTAKSVVELSLNPLFRRDYGSVYDGIQQFSQLVGEETAAEEGRTQERQLMQLIGSYLPTPQQQKYWLLGVDVTPAPRRFAVTLTDRGYIYHHEVAQTTHTNHLGRIYKVQLECWHNLLMSGAREYPMHQHPFTLIRARVFNEAEKQVFQRPLWLLVMGQHRNELSLAEGWKAYRRRYDVEHFFRFGKQRLLMTAYQTPEVQHEENWWQIAQLAYVQLWLARCLAEAMPRPWERYLPRFQTSPVSQEASPSPVFSSQSATRHPSVVQRDFGRIIQEIGTPAKAPKLRGKSPGRTKGDRQKPRKRIKVIKKSASKQTQKTRAA